MSKSSTSKCTSSALTPFERDFLQGQQACIAGRRDLLEGCSEAFERGYATQYELEQIQYEISRRKGNV